MSPLRGFSILNLRDPVKAARQAKTDSELRIYLAGYYWTGNIHGDAAEESVN
jgi:hypothetical protein